LDLISKDAFIVSIISKIGENVMDLEYIQEKIKNGTLAGLSFESENKTINDFEGNVYVSPTVA
jgi:hypothetical protein